MKYPFLIAAFMAANLCPATGLAAPKATPITAAEQVVPLEQGSNFRDLGGYPAADGKTVRRGLIFRSGAMPELTEADYARLAELRIRAIVDFRSNEERLVAPDLLDDRTGALFLSNDYSFRALDLRKYQEAPGRYSSSLYEPFATLLVPQYRVLFNRLLAHDGAVLFHCSAGQDRTGTAAALVLTALGVPRDVILADYHLSTQLRRPQYEMPPVKASDYPHNPLAEYYEQLRLDPGRKVDALYGSDGRAYLEVFLEGIDKRWGSVDAYLEQVIGLTEADVRKLRHLYLQ